MPSVHVPARHVEERQRCGHDGQPDDEGVGNDTILGVVPVRRGQQFLQRDDEHHSGDDPEQRPEHVFIELGRAQQRPPDPGGEGLGQSREQPEQEPPHAAPRGVVDGESDAQSLGDVVQTNGHREDAADFGVVDAGDEGGQSLGEVVEGDGEGRAESRPEEPIALGGVRRRRVGGAGRAGDASPGGRVEVALVLPRIPESVLVSGRRPVVAGGAARLGLAAVGLRQLVVGRGHGGGFDGDGPRGGILGYLPGWGGGAAGAREVDSLDSVVDIVVVPLEANPLRWTRPVELPLLVGPLLPLAELGDGIRDAANAVGGQDLLVGDFVAVNVVAGVVAVVMGLALGGEGVAMSSSPRALRDEVHDLVDENHEGQSSKDAEGSVQVRLAPLVPGSHETFDGLEEGLGQAQVHHDTRRQSQTGGEDAGARQLDQRGEEDDGRAYRRGQSRPAHDAEGDGGFGFSVVVVVVVAVAVMIVVIIVAIVIVVVVVVAVALLQPTAEGGRSDRRRRRGVVGRGGGKGKEEVGFFFEAPNYHRGGRVRRRRHRRRLRDRRGCRERESRRNPKEGAAAAAAGG
mmetsp:Transcript_28600/g.84248  ORF Transcript_28600/g.84248 Transcript_28600/m.84248 type:complete len:571 (-) Transcript_28600:12-1724(-)